MLVYWFCFLQNHLLNIKKYFSGKTAVVLHSMDHIYITGNFDLWNQADKSYLLKPGQRGISKSQFLCLPEIMNINLHAAVGKRKKRMLPEKAFQTGYWRCNLIRRFLSIFWGGMMTLNQIILL